MLLERLRILPNDDIVDDAVRTKCNALYRQWAANYKSVSGLQGIASLYKQLPKKTRAPPTAASSKVLRENEAEAQRENPFAADEEVEAAQRKRSYSRPQPVSPGASSSSSRSRAQSLGGGNSLGLGLTSSSGGKKSKTKMKPFNLEKEKPAILQAIAQSNIASTNLLNALKFINRETTKVSEDRKVMTAFEDCKSLRRQIRRRRFPRQQPTNWQQHGAHPP